MYSLKFFLVVLILAVVSCSNPDQKKEVSPMTLVPVDYSDPHFANLIKAKVVTPGKWKVTYLVLPDSTKYHDLYVQCSKDSVQATWCCKDLLLKNELSPLFWLETKEAIYFNFGDTANGPDLLVFSKKSNDKFREYRNIVKADYEKGIIVYLSERCFQEGKPYELMLGDIPKMKRHRIPYPYFCSSANKASAVDSVIFSARDVSIITTLTDNEKKYKQTRVIKR
ncbi:MAG: hypothetical protein ACM3N9_01230 [Syntrophothermus sp.]